MFNAYLRIVGYFLMFLIAPLGILCMYSAVAQYRQAGTARGWPTTLGEVTSASARTEISRSSSHRSRHGVRGGSSESRTYHGDVAYAYTVAGTRYEGSRVTIDEFGTGDRAQAEEIVSKYPVGSTVTVHYDPEQPSVAVLEPGMSGGSLRLFVFGLVVSTAAAGFAWLAFKESDPILTRPLVFLLPNWAAFLIPGPVKQWIVRRHMRRLGIDPDAKEADSRAGDGWGDG